MKYLSRVLADLVNFVLFDVFRIHQPAIDARTGLDPWRHAFDKAEKRLAAKAKPLLTGTGGTEQTPTMAEVLRRDAERRKEEL